MLKQPSNIGFTRIHWFINELGPNKLLNSLWSSDTIQRQENLIKIDSGYDLLLDGFQAITVLNEWPVLTYCQSGPWNKPVKFGKKIVLQINVFDNVICLMLAILVSLKWVKPECCWTCVLYFACHMCCVLLSLPVRTRLSDNCLYTIWTRDHLCMRPANRDDVTMQRRLSLAGRIHKMVPAEP